MPRTDPQSDSPPSESSDAGRHGGRLRAVAARLGLALLGAVLAVIVLELVLVVLAFFHGFRTDALPLGTGAVVLTVGDSHTFGVFYPPEQTYPGRLQDYLDARAPGAYRVVNRGLPGMNSSQVVRRMPEWVDRYQPRFVVFCAGINNTWNTADSEGEHRRPLAVRWLLGTRTAKLVRLISHARSTPQELPSDTDRPPLDRVLLDEGRQGVEHRDARTGELLARHRGSIRARARDLEEAAAVLVEDLVRLDDLARENDFELVLLTYAAVPTDGTRFSGLSGLSDTMVAYAEAHDLRYVDLRPRFRELLAEAEDRTRWFHSQTDDHPNAAGYDQVAQIVAAEIAGPDER